MTVLMLFYAFGGFAQKATLKNCYVTHQPQHGMTFHLDVQVDNDKGKDVWCIVLLAAYDKEGKNSYYFPRSEGNYKYDNHLAVSSKHCAIDNNTLFNNVQLYLPYSEITAAIGNKLDWKRRIIYCVKVVDADGRVLMEEWKQTPEMEYSQNGICYFCKGSRKCQICNETGWIFGYKCSICCGTAICTNCGGTGGFFYRSSYNVGDQVANPNHSQSIINNQPTTPSTYTREKIECHACKGSKKCRTCAGRGEYRIPSTGPLRDCDNCHGSGQCPVCHGRGYYY